jgi:hypothetical protein
MIELLLSTMLVAISALVGVLITYFTRIELKTYKKDIGSFRLFLLAIIILASSFFGYYAPLSIGGLAVGIIAGYFLRNFRQIFYEWFWLGVLLGSSFAFDHTVGMVTALLLAIYNMIAAGYANIPAVLKRISESKERVIEQIMFIACAIVSYAALSTHGTIVSSAAVYVAVAALIWVFVRDVFLIK